MLVLLFSVTATIDWFQFCLPGNLLCLRKIRFHSLYLLRVCPVWATLNRYDIADIVPLEFEIDAFCRRLFPAERSMTNVNGESFQKVSEDSFFFGRKIGVKKLLDEIACNINRLCAKEIRVFSLQKVFEP